jgi:hypothetical protein
MMGLTRKLLKDLVKQFDNDANRIELRAKAKEWFKLKKITLWQPEKEPQTPPSFVDIIRRSKLNRTQFLTIIENYSSLLSILEDHGITREDNHKVQYPSIQLIILILDLDQIRQIWEMYSPLVTAMMSETPPEDIVNNWTPLAKAFGELYVRRFLTEKVTPYMHVFIYHIGDFLNRLGNIECFANYDIESWHSINKRVRALAACAFGGRADDVEFKQQLPKQQLQHQERTREEIPIHKKDGQPPKKKRKINHEDKPNWTEKQLDGKYRPDFFEEKLDKVKKGEWLFEEALAEAAVKPVSESVTEGHLVQMQQNFINNFITRNNLKSKINTAATKQAEIMKNNNNNNYPNSQNTVDETITAPIMMQFNNIIENSIIDMSNDEIAKILTVLSSTIQGLLNDIV